MGTTTLKISEIAQKLNKEPMDVHLPNGRVLRDRITWEPSDLPEVFRHVATLGFGRDDHVIIDGIGPQWLTACVMHACHPAFCSINYPQGGCTLPLNPIRREGQGHAKDVSFMITEESMFTFVEFKLGRPNIDPVETMNEFRAPMVPRQKVVRISGRGPTAIGCALADAYAHWVKAVSMYQPGVGYVACISHCDDVPLGTVFPE